MNLKNKENLSLKITLVEGKQAPLYPDAQELSCDQVVVTEKGTVADLPLVDFVFKRGDETLIFVTTGRLICQLAAAIQGVNMRNHGVKEP